MARKLEIAALDGRVPDGAACAALLKRSVGHILLQLARLRDRLSRHGRSGQQTFHRMSRAGRSAVIMPRPMTSARSHKVATSSKSEDTTRTLAPLAAMARSMR